MHDLFVADTHLGLSAYGAADKDGIGFRTKDFLEAGEWAVNQALEIKPKRIFFLGDVYDNDHPRNKIRRRFKSMVRRLSKAGIETHILVGNHDASRLDHALEPIIEAEFPGVKVY